MKKIIYFIALLLTIVPSLFAQCQTYFPMRAGAVLEYAMYDARNREVGRMTYQVQSVNRGATEATVLHTLTANGRRGQVMSNTMTVKCRNGALLMEGHGSAGGNSLNVQSQAVILEYPAQMRAGQNLPDGVANVSGNGSVANGNNQQGANIQTTGDFRIFNRKVLAVESITVPAGTYQAYKIASESETRMQVNGMSLGTTHTTTTEWYVKNVGMVRTESSISGGAIGGLSRLSGGRQTSMVLVSAR
jgi:hypothetical protein